MPLTFPEPIDFTEATDKLASKGNLPTELNTAELREHVSNEQRDASFFSARVANARILQDFRDGATAILKGTSNVATQRAKLKLLLRSLGYQPEAGKEGTLQDLSSNVRLNLMLKTNVATVQGFGQWQQGNRPGALEAFPAMELLPSTSGHPRDDWPERWQAALAECGRLDGATDGSDRLVALKNHPIWPALGNGAGGYRDTLGNPYAPFAFGSERETEDVDYEDAVDLGVMEEGDEPLPPQPRGMNDGLATPLDALDDDLAQVLTQGFSNAVDVIDGVLQFANDARQAHVLRDRGDAVLRFLEEAS